MINSHVIALTLAAFFSGSTLFGERVEQSFHASKRGRLTVWQTTEGTRDPNGPIPGLDARFVEASFTLKWTDFGKKDREVMFEPAASSITNQKEAFFDEGGLMLDWDQFWNAQPLGFEIFWPFLADVNDVIDIFVGIDLTDWTSAPKPFSFGDVIPLVNGRNDVFLPGYLVGATPISYVAGSGWITASPLNGSVIIIAERDGSVVPEPGSLILLSTGGLTLSGYCWWRRYGRPHRQRSRGAPSGGSPGRALLRADEKDGQSAATCKKFGADS